MKRIIFLSLCFFVIDTTCRPTNDQKQNCKKASVASKKPTIEQIVHECIESNSRYTQQEKKLVKKQVSECFKEKEKQKKLALNKHLKKIDQLMNIFF